MGRFETKWLSRPENLAALADLSRHWIDKVHTRPPRIVVLDMEEVPEIVETVFGNHDRTPLVDHGVSVLTQPRGHDIGFDLNPMERSEQIGM